MPGVTPAAKVVLSVFRKGKAFSVTEVRGALLTRGVTMADITVRTALAALAKHGYIERIYRGAYRLPGDVTNLEYLEAWILKQMQPVNAVSAKELAIAYRQERGPKLPVELFQGHLEKMEERGEVAGHRGRHWFVATSKKPVIDIFEE